MTIINLTPHEVQVVLTNPLVKVIYAKSIEELEKEF